MTKSKTSSGGRLPYKYPEVYQLLETGPLNLLAGYSVLLINSRYYELFDGEMLDDYIDYEDEGEL